MGINKLYKKIIVNNHSQIFKDLTEKIQEKNILNNSNTTREKVSIIIQEHELENVVFYISGIIVYFPFVIFYSESFFNGGYIDRKTLCKLNLKQCLK